MTEGPSLVERIVGFLAEAGDWVNGGEVERFALSIGYKASNASRRLRELENDGTILRDERKDPGSRTRSVWYRIAEGKTVIL